MTLTEKIDRRIEECEGCAGKGYAEEHEHFGNAWGEHGLATFPCPLCESDRALKCAVKSLNRLASWNEGPLVDSSFDDPPSAIESRVCLAEISRLLSEGE